MVTTISLSSSSAATLKADAVVVGIAKGPDGPRLAAGAQDVETALGGSLLDSLTALGASGGEEEVTRVASLGAVKAPLVVAVGLGDAPAKEGDPFPADVLRRAAGAAARALSGSAKLALALPVAGAGDVEAVAQGALLGAYAFDSFKSAAPAGRGGGKGRETKRGPVREVVLCGAKPRDKAMKEALARGRDTAEAVNLARDLVNTPPGDLHPKEFVKSVQVAAEGAPVKVEALDEKALKKGGFGGILGVGQGSENPPRLLRITYTHPEATRTLALVGKGITFDSGGLSLKPPAGMVTMKCDMGGAAAVAGAALAIARLGVPLNVTAWTPLAENMPSGSAIRPSDVLRMYGGKTVEVLNTDAEGRLVLADAIVRACEEKPDVLVDVATLTGAMIMSLGTRMAGVMANDDALRETVCGAAETAGEGLWPMPLPVELRKSLDSEVADLANMGERMGGALVAGLFLKEFVADGVRWAHLDIAGPAFNEGGPYGCTPKGGTGFAVRTLVALAERLATAED